MCKKGKSSIQLILLDKGNVTHMQAEKSSNESPLEEGSLVIG